MVNGDDIKEVKEIVETYLKSLRSIDKVLIIFARRTNGNWKVVVRYPSPENPDADILSMLLINRTTKEVDYFKENISSY
jgi:PDZ domain-containing secreted protein